MYESKAGINVEHLLPVLMGRLDEPRQATESVLVCAASRSGARQRECSLLRVFEAAYSARPGQQLSVSVSRSGTMVQPAGEMEGWEIKRVV